MTAPTYIDEYVELLSCAMGRGAARSYVIARLEASLTDIAIERSCIDAIVLLLVELVASPMLSGRQLSEKVEAFQGAWRPHLNRAYLNDYEVARWRFINTFVMGRLAEGTSLGRCLDIGCGRGCVTSSIVANGFASEAVGIDTADFTSEWRERRSASRGGQRFERVSLRDLDEWLSCSGTFDTILLFYVLHHSDDYFSARTATALRRSLRPGGRVIVLEDSLVLGKEPLADPSGLSPQWCEWANLQKLYPLSVGHDVQAVLDFVAVQLLAGFSDVRMPANYKLGSEWVEFFSKVGYRTVQIENIGFPDDRDIDVPQALFVLRNEDSAGDANAGGSSADS
jgi:SAM-dependent methyltransferase